MSLLSVCQTWFTSPVSSLGSVYGSTSWKRLMTGALCMALLGALWLFCCSTTKKTISGMYFIQPAQAAMSKDSPACGIQEPEEECVRVSRESAVSTGGKKKCDGAVRRVQRLTPFPVYLRESAGSAYYEKPAASLSSPSLPTALSQNGATVAYWLPQRQHRMCHYDSGWEVTKVLVVTNCGPRQGHPLFRKRFC